MKTLRRWGLEGRIVFLRNKGLKYREIGDKTGITGSYVRALYKRSKQKKKIKK